MSLPTTTNVLDHLVHLTPPGSVSEASDQFRDLGFNVLPGGTHTGGLTANALVVLSDSVYLELISFLHPIEYYPEGSPERLARESHIWASKPLGWIDFAFLGNGSLAPDERISNTINKRSSAARRGDLYSPEVPGGRQRPDGKVLKWIMTAPSSADMSGSLPFFCGDVTPRKWRVSPDPAHANHPSTAQGIAYVRVLTSPENFELVKQNLTFVTGDSSTSTSTSDFSDHPEAVWTLDTAVRGIGTAQPSLILAVPLTDEETEFVAHSSTNSLAGIYEVGFRVKSEKSGSTKTPYGRISWVPGV